MALTRRPGRWIEVDSPEVSESCLPIRPMDNTALPQTKAQRDALFAQMFAGLPPAEAKPQSMTAILRPYRRQLIAKRREGYSLRQIAERLKASPLQLDVSPSMIKIILAGPAAKRRAKLKALAAQRAANLAAAKANAAKPAAQAAGA